MAATNARRHLHVHTRDLLALVTGAHSPIITLECISPSDTTTSPLLRILEIGCQPNSTLFNWRQNLEIHQFPRFHSSARTDFKWSNVDNLLKFVRHSKKTVTELIWHPISRNLSSGDVVVSDGEMHSRLMIEEWAPLTSIKRWRV